MGSRVQAACTAVAALLVLGGCGGAAEPAQAAGDGFPTTVDVCGNDVRIESRPQRVVALGPSEVTSLVAAGAAGTLVGRDDAGLKSAPYTPEIRDAVAAVPQLGSGGEVSRESLIALSPDLVVGSVSESITPESLGAVGIPMISLAGNCGSNHAPGVGDGTADFDDVVHDVETFGRLLGTSDRATTAAADMRDRVAGAEDAAVLAGRSAAAVIVYQNTLKAYGSPSMAHTQLQALGATDVFGDVDSRVFEANIEELAARDPDVVMILSYGETDEEARQRFLAVPGASTLSAVRSGSVFVQPYEYSSQGSLSVNGLENMARGLR